MQLNRFVQNKAIKILFISIWAFISVLLFPRFLSDDSLRFSNSVFSILLFISIFVLLYIESKRERSLRRDVYTHCLGFLFSVMTAFGYSLDVYGTIDVKTLLFSILIYTHIYAKLLSLIWHYLMIAEIKLSNPSENGKHKVKQITTWLTNHPIAIALLLLLMWLPAFIADFPGGFRYDATSEFNQIANGYNGNFPLLHSAIITHLLPFMYNLTGSYNSGITVYVSLQMIMISAMYTHIICTFAKRKINSVLLKIVFLYCGLFPVIQILVVQEVRDVLFSALLMYSVFLLYLLETDKESFFKKKIKNPLLLSITIVLTILSRNNNAKSVAYIIIFSLSFIIWLVNRKKYMIGATILSVSCIVLFFCFSTLLNLICQPFEPASQKGSLSLLSQSLARAYLMDEWSPEEKKELSKWINVDKINYIPENADSTNGIILAEAGDKKEFLLFVAKTGLKHFNTFFEAVLANTQNMWFPPSVIDGYNQRFKQEGEPYWNWDKCYYSITSHIEEPAEHMNYLPSILNYYTQIGLNISFEKIPIISMLFSIGFQFWILLNCLFYNMFRRHKKLLLPLFIILAYMLISAFVPLILLRYFAAIFFCVPMLFVFTMQPSHIQNISTAE